jgi:NAD(P)-dependent dehydrogenase (short-subunit alcohol dehydrogenase family)
MDPMDLTGRVPEPQGWTMPGLDRRTVVLTGAGSGIGAATARVLGAAGARLLLVDRDPAGLAAVAAELDGDRTVTLVADLRDGEAPERIVAAAIDAFGEITTLLHIAGVFAPNWLPEASQEEWDAQLRVNVEAPYWLTRAAAPHLVETGGQVVFCGSTSAHVGSAGAVIYCTSKFAVLGMTKAMAAELAPQGVRVNAISPGTTATPINDELFAMGGFVEKTVERNPDRRIAQAHEHVGAIAYLISDLAQHVHGQDIVVDGGHIAV